MTIPAVTAIRSVELEITGTCNERCLHCCTSSSPQASPGSMTRKDWSQVIEDVAALGIPTVQFIGGEPTLSPYLPRFVDQALAAGLAVEVYSNLTHVRPSLWRTFDQTGVSLGVSYYSDDRAQHETITRTRSLDRIRANITEAVQRGIPIRAGIVRVLEGQRVEQAAAELRRLGVDQIRMDRTRKVGRAADALAEPSVDELCGHCFRHRVAVSPDGDVYGCILSRFLPAGNVRETPLADILTSDAWAEIEATIPAPHGACPPDDSGDCDPANTVACPPAYGVAPALNPRGVLA
ncbi:radical SAM protein [Streptomyces sp. NPDC054796]